MDTQHYRPDIDGLRAIAVLSVVLYHFGADWLPGGFTGVDVFFVISGYIITSNMMYRTSQGSFSLLDFYKRRVKRILPALVVMIFSVLAVGWLYFTPTEYRVLGKSAAFAALGLGNLYFYGNTDYFDPSADTQPLLHTWSLGVEEQFYLVWPVAFWALWSLLKTKKRIAILLAVFTVGAIVASEILTQWNSKAAFYLPFARAWELSLGCLVAFLPAIRSTKYSSIATGLGLALVATSVATLNTADRFPGLNALYACIGAALIVYPKTSNGLVFKLVSFEPLRFVGLISYSLYLWHWPVIVLYRELTLDQNPSISAICVLLALSIALSVASYKFVEQPFRGAKWSSAWMPITMTLVATAASASVFVFKGYPARIPPEILGYSTAAEDYSANRPKCHRTFTFNPELNLSCVFGDDNAPPQVAVWGDSHGVEIGEAIGERMRASGESMLLMTYSSCPPALNFEAPLQKGCKEFTSSALKFLLSREQIRTVVLAGYWELYLASPDKANIAPGLEQAVATLAAAGKRVIIVASNPEITGVRIPQAAVRYAMLGKLTDLSVPIETHRKNTAQSREIIDGIKDRHPSVVIFDPASTLCSEDSCPMVLNDKAILFDDNHLTTAAARIVAEDIPLH